MSIGVSEASLSDIAAVTNRNDGYGNDMFGANGAIGGMDVYTLLTKAVLIIICCIASTELPKRLFVTAAGKMNEKAAFAVKSVLTLALLALSFVFLIGDSYNPFLYFRF